MEATGKHAHGIPYRTYIIVWLALLALTTVLVLVSELFHEALAVWAMLVLTPVKAGLVFFFFMHLKYEKTSLKALVFMTLGLLVMVIALFFLDIAYR
jgi:cytochrome c oxidase subunit 4